MIKTFVINLKDSNTRRDSLTQRLEQLGINFELFEAIDGRRDKHPFFEKYDDNKRIKYRRKKLSGGELGCFASHYLLWQKCIELNHPIIVMEDDIIVENLFIEAVKITEKYIDKLSCLRLSAVSLHRRPYLKVKAIGSFNLADHIRGPAGTQCYALSPLAAKAFIDAAETWFLPVDDYMDRYWSHGIDCYSLMPFPVKLADVGSEMIRNKKGQRSLVEKIRQEFYGRTERINRNLYRQKIKQKKQALLKSL
jgi:glycosyl transferase family 25